MVTTLALSLSLLAPHDSAIDEFGIAGPNAQPLPLLYERFEIVAPNARCVIVGERGTTDAPLDPRRVRAFRARSADGSSTGFVAISPLGALGWLDTPEGRLVLEGAQDDDAPGLRPGPWRWAPEGRPSAPPIESLCAMLHAPGDDGGLAGSPSPTAPALTRLVELAIDADYEFFSIFDAEAATTDYITALYAANSMILERDAGVRLRLAYVRVFATPTDPYDAADPLGPFRDEWEANQTAVHRDLAQLLSGRRNLPYGGVAWLNAACANHGYSVSGYMIGSFANSRDTNPGNWDIIVSTHELGHNVGTLHTHDYGLDSCNAGTVQRGTIMSYCHVVSGATSNIDLRFHRGTGDAIRTFVGGSAPCLAIDCNGNGVDDAEEIASGALSDTNGDSIADECQDCDGDGTLDPVEIAQGAADINLNGVPDDCEADCNANGQPDLFEIAQALASDVDGNSVIDSCDPDCDGNAVADGVDLIVSPMRDLDRDGRIDTCEDCDGNGTADPTQLEGALGLWTIQQSPALLVELDGRSGVRRRSIDLATYGVQVVSAIETTPAGALLLAASGGAGPMLLEFNRTTASMRTVVAAGAGFPLAARLRWANLPSGAAPCVDALSTSQDSITRWRIDTGAFVLTTHNLAVAQEPVSFARSGDSFFILNRDGSILRSVGAAYPTLPFASLPAGADATDILVLADGRVLVTDRATDSIQGFSTGGAALGRFDLGPNPTSSVALIDPTGLLAARQDSNVVFALAAGANAAIHGFRASDGYYLRTYRIYRVDAIGSSGFAQIWHSTLDANGNFELDSCEAHAAADINRDGLVDGLDLTALLSAWGSANADADVNNDGVVDGLDMTIVLSAWD